MNITEKQKELFQQVRDIFYPEVIYLVGGAVRDMVLGVEPHDYDFCCSLEPDMIENKIRTANKRAYLTGKRFGTIGCKIDGEMIEVTTFRGEQYSPHDRKPTVNFVKDIVADLSRRDFTINAIALRLDNFHLIDPFGGREDLKNKCIRAVGFPKQRFHEDPLRMLRCIRFATKFGYEIESKTYEKLCHCAPSILDISKERWMDELDKILLTKEVSIGLNYLWRTNLFNYMIPELSLQLNYDQNSAYHNWYLDEHTSKVVEACPKDLNLRWAALLHDIAKPFVRTNSVKLKKIDYYDEGIKHDALLTKTNYIGHEILGAEMVKRIALHLKWSNERTEAVVNLVRHHLEDDCPLREYDNLGKI
jgi:putative nucleotidyltransferase with HDIG domain